MLSGTGATERQALCDDHDNGERDFSSSRFKQAVYGCAEVKDALILAQHGKCCFCEQKVFGEGDVEHYRPKAGAQQVRGQSISRPGYYWLAYTWGNLLLCCTACNTRNKQNLFPLADPAKRARSHRDNLADEEPLLLDPTQTNPEDHITWRGALPVLLDSYGRATIDALRLDDDHRRHALVENRREHLAKLRLFYIIVQNAAKLSATAEGKSVVTEAQKKLTEAEADDAPFAAMARAAIRASFRDALTVTDGSPR